MILRNTISFNTSDYLSFTCLGNARFNSSITIERIHIRDSVWTDKKRKKENSFIIENLNTGIYTVTGSDPCITLYTMYIIWNRWNTIELLLYTNFDLFIYFFNFVYLSYSDIMPSCYYWTIFCVRLYRGLNYIYVSSWKLEENLMISYIYHVSKYYIVAINS